MPGRESDRNPGKGAPNRSKIKKVTNSTNIMSWMWKLQCMLFIYLTIVSHRPLRGLSGVLKGCSESVPNHFYFLSLQDVGT